MQIEAGLRQVFGDHRRLLFERQLDGGLAGHEAFRRKAEAAAAARESYFQRAGGIDFEEQAAVGVGDGDGVIQHRAKNRIDRKLRMKERGGFQQKVQFAQAAAGGLRTGDVLDTREKLRNRFVV